VGKLKIPEEVMEYFRKTGAEAANARADHSKSIERVGKKGGRPKEVARATKSSEKAASEMAVYVHGTRCLKFYVCEFVI